MRKNIALEEGLSLLLKEIAVTELIEISLENAMGKVLAADIVASESFPDFRKSAYDGYCTKSTYFKDLNSPLSLDVLGTLKAGAAIEDDLADKRGAYKIMTGARVPDFHDVVIPKEWTDNGSEVVIINQGGHSGDNIIRVGEDVLKGEVLIKKGTKIHWGIVAMLAQLGISTLKVYEAPKVGFISTGDELKYLGEPLKLGEIYNSNEYAISSYLKEIGVDYHSYGIAKDKKEMIKDLLDQALSENNLVLTTGGASVGDYDYLLEVYQELGVEVLFWGLDIKPGRPVLAGVKNKVLVVSLPGTPAAALIALEKVVIPLIGKMKGLTNFQKTEFTGTMVEDFKKTSSSPRFIRLKAKVGEHGYELALSGKQNASVLKSMLDFNAIGEIPSGVKIVKGSKVKFVLREEEGL